MNEPEHLWTLDEALAFIRDREAFAFQHGYCLALGGSILLRGWSDHDLDIVCIPANRAPVDRSAYHRFVDWIDRSEPGGIVSLGGWNGLSNKIETRCPKGRKVDWFVFFDPNT